MKQKYWIYASLCALIWSLMSVFIRLVFGSFSAISLAAARTWLSAIIMLIICVITKVPPPKTRDIPLFFITGITGFAGYFTLYNIGFKLVTVATGNVLVAAAPFFTALIAWVFLKERIRPLGWFFIGVSFIGIIILAFWDGVLSINIGVLWLLVAAASFSVYSLMLRRLTLRYKSVQCSSYSMMASAIMMTPFLPVAISDAIAAPFIANAVMVSICIACSFSFIFWAQALSLAKRAADVVNFLYVPPFLGAILAFIIYREFPGWGTIIGGIVILFGLWMYQRKA